MKRLLITLCVGTLLAPGAWAEEDRPDMHFRPFAIEPGDRVEWGQGHLVAGLDLERRPEPNIQHRFTMPLEATVGLPAGFVAVLAFDGAARTLFNDGATSSQGSRETLLKYAFPEWRGIHFAVMAARARRNNDAIPMDSHGYTVTFDTAWGDMGFSQSWDRPTPPDNHGGREIGINLFRLGLGTDGKWGLAGEARHVNAANDQRIDHWLFGVARIVGRGVLVDLAVGGESGDAHGRRLTTGVGWFF